MKNNLRFLKILLITKICQLYQNDNHFIQSSSMMRLNFSIMIKKNPKTASLDLKQFSLVAKKYDMYKHL